MKRFLCLLLCAALCAALLGGCDPAAELSPFGLSPIESAEEMADVLTQREGYSIRAAVYYSGSASETSAWQDTLDYLLQPLLVNLEAQAVDADTTTALGAYDVVYLDESLLRAGNADQVRQAVIDYTSAGGAVFAPNAFYDFFPPEYFGVASFEKLAAYPEQLELPGGAGDLTSIQEIIGDFHSLYTSFADAQSLMALDYGYAAVPDGALALVTSGDLALYTLNHYGEGCVLLTNPLLPNAYQLSSFSMAAQSGGQTAFSSTTASCNQLLLNAFASYVSQQIYGFSIDRVFGYFGSPSMSWELHYEEITGIANDSLQTFSQLCQEYGQIPSFTLIRNSYWWFLRAESLTYLLHDGGEDPLSYQMDLYENAYSSGTHVDSDGEWLSLASVEDAGSYFVDYPEYQQRLTPVALDYDGDGLTDFFCGSSDGQIYYYQGCGFTGLDGRLRMEEAQPVTDSDGHAISLGSFSAPALVDVDGDGLLDLLSGSPDGRILWYRGDGTLSFTPEGALLETGLAGQILPAVGDVDGDGAADLMVGSNEGSLRLYYGRLEEGVLTFSAGDGADLSGLCADGELGDWLAPFLGDLDGDGSTDLAVGTFDGYVALFSGDETGSFTFDGFVTADEMNYKGNHNLKFGNYAVPVFTDLNGDGALDLLCGSQEYGLAYPIDSPYFPYAEQLQEQVDYAQEHHYYLGVHFYTNAYASPQREAYELAAHRQALAAYGIDTQGVGANQHTWYTSSLSPSQSMDGIYGAGLLWQSGFSPSGASFAPQVAAENVIALPFFLTVDGERTLLVQNNSVLPYQGAEWTDLSAKYGMPVCVYYHCDFVYESDEQARSYLQQLSDFQWQHGYNFMKEDQLMYATAAAYNLRVEVEATERGMVISPSAISDDFPLYDADAQSSMGIRLTFSQSLGVDFSTDSGVWKETEGGLAVGLAGPVEIFPESAGADEAHIAQINTPAQVTADEAGAEIVFLGDGMLQAVVQGSAATEDAGWTVEERDGKTIFTKYGAADTLHITF